MVSYITILEESGWNSRCHRDNMQIGTHHLPAARWQCWPYCLSASFSFSLKQTQSERLDGNGLFRRKQSKMPNRFFDSCVQTASQNLILSQARIIPDGFLVVWTVTYPRRHHLTTGFSAARVSVHHVRYELHHENYSLNFQPTSRRLIFRKRGKCSYVTGCSDVESLYQHDLRYKDLNTPKYGRLSYLSDCWLIYDPLKVTTLHPSTAVMHCTGASGTVPLFQDGGRVGTSLLLAAAARQASSDVHGLNSNKSHKIIFCKMGKNI